MGPLTRGELIELLNRVLLRAPGENCEFGVEFFGSTKRATLKVCIDGHYISESLPISELGEAATRALGVTGE